MSPDELKLLRERSGITLIELAGWTGLPSAFIGQIEDKSVVALESDLDRIETVLRRLMSDRGRSS